MSDTSTSSSSIANSYDEIPRSRFNPNASDVSESGTAGYEPEGGWQVYHAETLSTNSSNAELVDCPKPKSRWGARFTFAVMAFLGFANVYAMRVNLSVAIVAMVNSTECKRLFYFMTLNLMRLSLF